MKIHFILFLFYFINNLIRIIGDLELEKLRHRHYSIIYGNKINNK